MTDLAPVSHTHWSRMMTWVYAKKDSEKMGASPVCMTDLAQVSHTHWSRMMTWVYAKKDSEKMGASPGPSQSYTLVKDDDLGICQERQGKDGCLTSVYD